MPSETEKDNVESLFGNPLVRREPNADLVETLEGMLEEAKAGEIVGLAGVTLYHDRQTGFRLAGLTTRAVIGTLVVVTAKLSADD